MKLQKLGGYAAIAAVCGGIAYLAFSALVQKRLGNLTDLTKVMAAVSAAPFGLGLPYCAKHVRNRLLRKWRHRINQQKSVDRWPRKMLLQVIEGIRNDLVP